MDTVGDYKLATKQDFDDLVATCEDKNGWNVCYDSKDVKVWDKSVEGTPVNMVKLWGRIPVAASICYDVLHDPEYRKTWDENMHEGHNIVQLDPFNDIGYYSAKSPFFGVSGRDFCNQRSWFVEKDKSAYFIINHSVIHPSCPPHKNFVRAKSIRTGYWLSPDPEDPSFSQVLYITQTDLQGMIPTWIVNKATKQFAPRLLENLIKVGPKYTEWKEAHNPDAKPWLAEGKSYWWEQKGDKEESSKKEEASEKTENKNLSPSDAKKKTKSPRKDKGSKSPRKDKSEKSEKSDAK